MKEFEIRFIREDLCASAKPGASLLQVQIDSGLHPDAPCNGRGACGKCLVNIRRPGETEWKTARACQTLIDGELEVLTLSADQSAQILFNSEPARPIDFDPQLRQFRLKVAPCPMGESSADWERLKAALKAAAGREDWQPNLALASALGDCLRANKYELYALVDADRVLKLSGSPIEAYMIAFDIGTTSIAGYLLHADRDEVLARRGMLNPQKQYGADVIMRAEHAIKHGARTLSIAVREALNQMVGELTAAAGIDPQDIYAVDVVGNTCMHHLFLGISPASLVHSPYNPALSEALVLRAADYGLDVSPEATLRVPPVIAGFVGADTVACMVARDWSALDRLTLLIDIGTNGEIALGNRERMITCSTAAGPAFEGAKIECGMRGTQGAIDHVRLENGKIVWHALGEGAPKGICGSGLLDLIAALLDAGEIDPSGKLRDSARYLLPNTEVYLTQRDIREVQLAKGAICAGIQLLAQTLGVTLEMIERVEIAGAFGNYMNPASACRIGLIPAELLQKITSIGNAAGEGAKRMLQSKAAWQSAIALAQRAEFLELAALPAFQDEFVDALEFPEIGDE